MANNKLPILYSFRRCPYAIRARMALRYAQVALDLREVALRDKPPSMVAVSPKATVPVLVLPDGRVIDESRDIMAWALDRHDPDGWCRAADESAAAAWVADNDLRFKPLLDAYKYPERHPAQTQQQHRALACEVFVAPLDRQLVTTPFLLGDHVSWSDVAVYPFVRQFAMVDAAWFDDAPFPGVRRWLRHWLDSALFAAVMDKHPPWNDPARAASTSA